MAAERTLSIIKPDATRRNLTGRINAKFEEAGLRIVAQKRLKLTEAQAGAFYAVHKERPFYKDLVSFMTSGPVVVQVLEGDGRGGQEPRGDGRHQPGQRRRPAPSARNSPRASRPTASTARTAPRTRRPRSPSSSPASRSPAERRRALPGGRSPSVRPRRAAARAAAPRSTPMRPDDQALGEPDPAALAVGHHVLRLGRRRSRKCSCWSATAIVPHPAAPSQAGGLLTGRSGGKGLRSAAPRRRRRRGRRPAPARPPPAPAPPPARRAPPGRAGAPAPAPARPASRRCRPPAPAPPPGPGSAPRPRPALTRCTVQPCSRTPAASARAWVSRPGKGRQQRGVDVDHPPLPAADEARRQHAHEAGQRDQLRRRAAPARPPSPRSKAVAVAAEGRGSRPPRSAPRPPRRAPGPPASARLDSTSAISAG